MAEGWVGKSISIKCIEPAGAVFQGKIKGVSPEVITIVRAFRNGVPVRKPETEVKINSSNIHSLELIPEVTYADNGTGVSQPPEVQSRQRGASKNNNNGYAREASSSSASPYQSVQQLQLNTLPQTRNNSTKSPNNNGKKYFANSSSTAGPNDFPRQSSTKPIDMPVHAKQYNGGPRSSNNNQQVARGSYQENTNAVGANNKNSRRFQNSKLETFGTPVNDPTMDEDFDFEKNLALFDKQAVWEKINQMNSGKPDLLHHQAMAGSHSRQQPQPKYRHDENILQSAPTQYRQIEVDYNSSRDYVSDDGLIVPSIPLIVRNRVQTAAEALGLTWERQIEMLSRGACDTALALLGGAPRLKPNNRHQWPNIVVVCEEPYNDRKSEVGICTGRILATHGLKVVVYVKELTGISRMSYELDLFKATGNEYTGNISELPSVSDLIIISSRTSQLSPDITKWITESRSPVLAIDPPAVGFVKIQAKCSILPILPLDDINTHACGRLYLCNLGIPNKFFHSAGIKYSSPFGHKHVIPLHPDH